MTLTISLILYIVAVVLMALSSVPVGGKVDLFKLGWAFAVAAFVFAAT